MTKQFFFITCIFILSSQKNLYAQQTSKDGFLFKFYPQLQNAFQIVFADLVREKENIFRLCTDFIIW